MTQFSLDSLIWSIDRPTTEEMSWRYFVVWVCTGSTPRRDLSECPSTSLTPHQNKFVYYFKYINLIRNRGTSKCAFEKTHGKRPGLWTFLQWMQARHHALTETILNLAPWQICSVNMLGANWTKDSSRLLPYFSMFIVVEVRRFLLTSRAREVKVHSTLQKKKEMQQSRSSVDLTDISLSLFRVKEGRSNMRETLRYFQISCTLLLTNA